MLQQVNSGLGDAWSNWFCSKEFSRNGSVNSECSCQIRDMHNSCIQTNVCKQGAVLTIISKRGYTYEDLEDNGVDISHVVSLKLRVFAVHISKYLCFSFIWG